MLMEQEGSVSSYPASPPGSAAPETVEMHGIKALQSVLFCYSLICFSKNIKNISNIHFQDDR